MTTKRRHLSQLDDHMHPNRRELLNDDVWRQIPNIGTDWYFVSIDGRIRNKFGKDIKVRRMRSKAAIVCLWAWKKGKAYKLTQRVARFVYAAWSPKPLPANRAVICIDGNTQNIHFSNLKLGHKTQTRKQIMARPKTEKQKACNYLANFGNAIHTWAPGNTRHTLPPVEEAQ